MADKYIGLTGATGLLGSYLLKDLLIAGRNVAVFVRKSRTESASGRIETILQYFEKSSGHSLPRPIVIESDLGKESLGISTEANSWIRRHVDTMLHNAASLEFLHDKKTNEPYHSNIEGTKNVLGLCRECSIKQFHHVSTAYVCGLREGKVYENELECSQKFGNDYEASKATSERAVRDAPFLDKITVYRPAIIVGDSVTGYTPTYHGFYTPLKILYPIINAEDVSVEGVKEVIAALGMNGDDEKNFVPVDWISRVMTHIVLRPEHHGSCYHLVPGNRTKIETMSEVLAEALSVPKKNDKKVTETQVTPPSNLIETFLSQMDVYRAYWRNDPVFDTTNTLSVAGHIPCPVMDREQMRILTDYAVRSNFGWPRPKPAVLGFDSGSVLHLSDREITFSPATEFAKEFQIGLKIVGAGGGDWKIRFVSSSGDRWKMSTEKGMPVVECPVARMNIVLFKQILEGTLALHTLTCGNVAWENTNDDWIKRYGNELLDKVIKK
jgi:thioester reductase-like protein